MERYKTIRVNGRKRLEHVYLWEQANGTPLPKGCVIHHKNGDGRDNRLENLQMMTNAEHVNLHRQLRQMSCDVVDPTDPAVIKTRERSSKSQKAFYQRNRDSIRQKKHEYSVTHKAEIAAYNKKYNAEHREEILAHQREYRAANVDKMKAYEKKRYAEHREELKEKTRRYVRENHEMVLAKSRLAYAADPEKYRERAREYREKNPDKVKETLIAYREKNREFLRARDRWRYAIEMKMPPEEIERRRIEKEEIKQRIKNSSTGQK